RGLIRGSSFRAMVDLNDKKAVEWPKEGDKEVLTIKRFSALKDVAPTFSPAYQGTDVKAVMRSLDDWHLWEATQLRIAKYENKYKPLIDKKKSQATQEERRHK